jgi:hypothetical protein
MVDEDEDFKKEQPKFGEEDDNVDEEYYEDYGNQHKGEDAADNSFNWQWDDNLNQDYAHSKSQADTDNVNNTNNVNNEDNVGNGSEPDEGPELEMPEGVEQLTPEDIRIFLENESIVVAQSASQEVIGHHAPHLHMIFDTKEQAYKFYNEYASICGFSVKKAGNYKGKHVGDEIGNRHTYTCSKFGKVVDDEVLEKRKQQKQERK